MQTSSSNVAAPQQCADPARDATPPDSPVELTIANGDPFLPLYSSTNAMKFMWSRPPFKEYQRIRLFRTDVGFGFEASLFMPLRQADGLDESEEEKPI